MNFNDDNWRGNASGKITQLLRKNYSKQNTKDKSAIENLTILENIRNQRKDNNYNIFPSSKNKHKHIDMHALIKTFYALGNNTSTQLNGQLADNEIHSPLNINSLSEIRQLNLRTSYEIPYELRRNIYNNIYRIILENI